jgi:NAD(P)-dependent dehydrogenase (short-subunit alcohol dehydrogenase family)
MRFMDRVAIVTAAPSGIGRAAADIMARDEGEEGIWRHSC